MTLFKNKYRIESNRWQFWDYSAPGKYFITICINNRLPILGQVAGNQMVLSESGEIVKNEIEKMPQYHPRIILDEWVVMPNHIHLLIELGAYNYDNGAGNRLDRTTADETVEKIHDFSPPTPISVSQPAWWCNPDYQPTTGEIKQYRKMRRNMIIPKILGKLQMITSKNINLLQNTPGQKIGNPATTTTLYATTNHTNALKITSSTIR